MDVEYSQDVVFDWGNLLLHLNEGRFKLIQSDHNVIRFAIPLHSAETLDWFNNTATYLFINNCLSQ